MNVHISGDGASASEFFPTFQTRPIDKFLKVIVILNPTEATPVQTTLFTAVCPCTVFGLRWTHAVRNDESPAKPLCHWVIALVPDGGTIGTMSITDGDDFYKPEQNVLAYGVVRLAPASSSEGPNVVVLEGSVGTKRKMRVGDSIVFSFVTNQGTSTTDMQWDSIVQLFTRS